MEARVKLLGHPVHQMLIVLPLGLLSGAVIFDIINLAVPGREWNIVAYWLILTGVITGAFAAIFGFLDYLKIPRNTRAKRVGRIHGIGNVVVLWFFALSWWVRDGAVNDPIYAAYALSFVGGALSLITGWLGGELVDRLSVGVDDGANLNAPSSLKVRSVSGDQAA